MDETEAPREATSGPGSGGVTGKGFQPGQSGNPNGRPKGRSITAILRRLLDEVDEATGQSRGEMIAREMVLKAALGSHKFAREILDRTEGKVTQPVDVTTQGEAIRTVFYVPDNGRDPNPETAAGPPGDLAL